MTPERADFGCFPVPADRREPPTPAGDELGVGALRWTLLVLGILCCLLGCNAPDKSNLGNTAQANRVHRENGEMELDSSAFPSGGGIPQRFTCEGEDISPGLSWKGVPGAARTLALIVEDPDAPDPKAPQLIWTHWILYDIPHTSQGLSEAVSRLPGGTREGSNDWKETGYRGPCPPVGRHRYFFKLYAIDQQLGDLSSPNRSTLLDAISGHVVASAELMGTYQKQNQ